MLLSQKSPRHRCGVVVTKKIVPRHAGRHANSMCGSLRSPIPADDEERLTDKIDRELCSEKFQNSDKNGIVDDAHRANGMDRKVMIFYLPVNDEPSSLPLSGCLKRREEKRWRIRAERIVTNHY